MAKPTDERIAELLEQILTVTALQVAADKSMTERARLLKTAGLDNQTIARILNTSSAVIRTLTSNLNRRVLTGKQGKRRSPSNGR
jgi:hypothetical protein